MAYPRDLRRQSPGRGVVVRGVSNLSTGTNSGMLLEVFLLHLIMAWRAEAISGLETVDGRHLAVGVNHLHQHHYQRRKSHMGYLVG